MKKKFHILFKLDNNQYNSQGETFEGTNVIEAIGVFQKKYPASIYLASYSLDDTAGLMVNTEEITASEDISEAKRISNIS